ncbi:hypothetical protein BHL62_19670 [Xanthomonas oryzae pv. oryzae]|nr:hypothetical protein BHL62_19670 [Xanthomonas oryzae pv. oryzae]
MPHARTFFHALMQQVLDLAGRNVGKPQMPDRFHCIQRSSGTGATTLRQIAYSSAVMCSLSARNSSARGWPLASSIGV